MVTGLSIGQKQAIEEMKAIADARPGAIVVHRIGPMHHDQWLPVEISVGCANTVTAPEGVPLELREYAIIHVPTLFPFVRPACEVTHDRFARSAHVTWGKWICLYLSDADWDPSDGMFGFVERLIEWFNRAAAHALDGVEEPVHPPVAGLGSRTGCVVVRADVPVAATTGWVGAALMARRYVDQAGRLDVVDWIEIPDGPPADAAALARLRSRLTETAEREQVPILLGPAIMLPQPLSFEFPNTVADLVAAVNAQGINLQRAFGLLATAVCINAEEADDNIPLPMTHLLIGAPMRGVSGQKERLIHLEAWRLNVLDSILVMAYLPILARWRSRRRAKLRKAYEVMEMWAKEAPVRWTHIYEMRPQIVTRRDQNSPAAWLRDRRVTILGCGALGARIAEHCVRAGARQVLVADRSLVSPGVLVRQPYADRDIGKYKAEVLAARLAQACPTTTVTALVGDVLETFVHAGRPETTDLLIDATANRAVSKSLERLRWSHPTGWPPLLTVGVGHRCTRGLAGLALPSASGGGADIMHRLALTAWREPRLRDMAEDFFPETGRRDLFQPEPGCSDPTFTGSDVDAGILAGQLLTWGLSLLGDAAAGRRVSPAVGCFIRLASPAHGSALEEFRWERDPVVIDDPSSGYQIRLWREALEAMQAEAQATREVFDAQPEPRYPLTETGGVLIGRIDDASRVVWVTAADGPSPDSEQATNWFRHGVRDVAANIEQHRAATGRHVHFTGMWHTHPGMAPSPSRLDDQAAQILLVPGPHAPARAVIMILGGRPPVWDKFLHEAGLPLVHACLVTRIKPLGPRPVLAPPPPGGGGKAAVHPPQ
ncbi:ThiF family adenylyltransferase [Nonomuraea zeae]|uniref:Thiamine biosynthesis protein ThiF n=1 Tax=Nonomuraea zeae TaxID=1642303 RepID=A0A5S4FS91_9ACTN|nr:ThiF family adenylyltransferase [Nonomuraea zeae]TMR23625.1 hypothetical protein ETD85_47610 [Nonomuraea zeae]